MSGPPARAPKLLASPSSHHGRSLEPTIGDSLSGGGSASWPVRRAQDRAMKARTLDYMIAIKQAELRAVVDLLRWEPSIVRQLQPSAWVERLAEVSRLHNYTGHPSYSFEALVRDAHVPRAASNHKTIRNAG